MKFVTLSLFFLFTAFLSAEEIAGVTYQVEYPNEKWKIGSSFKNEQQELITYVLENETAEKWTELFTAQAIAGLKVTPLSFFEMFVQQLKTLVPKEHVQTMIIRSNNQDFLAEWWIDAKTSEDQHEWVRMIPSKGSLVILRYTTKKKNALEYAKSKSLALLNRAKILH